MAYDLIVIGGGLVGGAIAWGAARRGASVALLDEGDVAFAPRAAISAWSGCRAKAPACRPTPTGPAAPRSSGRSSPARLAGTTGVDVGAAPARRLRVLPQRRGIAKTAPRCCSACTTKAATSARACWTAPRSRAMVPGLGDRVVGASFCPIDGHASPLYLLRALHAGLPAIGGRLSAGAQGGRDRRRAAQLHRSLRRRTLHRGEAGDRRRTGQPRPGADGRAAHAGHPVAGPDHRHRAAAPASCDYPTHVARQTEEGSVMLGDSQEDVGFDISAPKCRSLQRDRRAQRRDLPGAEATPRSCAMWAALRVMSPDGFPIYEQSGRFPGAFAATCHSGVTLAGAHALALAPAILAGELPETLTAFSSRRFAVAA